MRDHGARLVDRRLQIGEHLRENLLSRSRSKRAGSRADPRVQQQVVDQSLHARGAVHDERDELVGRRVEPSA